GGVGPRPGHEVGNAGGGVGERPAEVGGADAGLEVVLGDVEADDDAGHDGGIRTRTNSHRARPPRTRFGLVNADRVPVTIRTTDPRDAMRTPLLLGLPSPCAKRSRTELAPPPATQSSDGCRGDNPTYQRKGGGR